MKVLVPFALVSVLALCDPTAVCRCEERTLGEYFAGADEVAVGRLVTIEEGAAEGGNGSTPVKLLHFELTAPLFKTGRTEALTIGSQVTYRTATSTAECGIQGQLQGVYVLFASDPTSSDIGAPAEDGPDRDPSVGRIDSCSGSRAMLAPGATEPVGFVDVPARFVMQQLNGLSGLDLIARVAANAPDGTESARTHLLGLLDVAALSHAGRATLFGEPREGATPVGSFDSYDGVESREAGYEEAAAVVFGVSAGWYRLRLIEGGYGWLPPDQAGTFHPYPQIAVNRLNYIPAPWHGFVWPSPGAGLPTRTMAEPGQREVPIEVLEEIDLAGSPWLRINVLQDSPCEVAAPRVRVSGWIPAWGPAGEPVVWFYSRGC